VAIWVKFLLKVLVPRGKDGLVDAKLAGARKELEKVTMRAWLLYSSAMIAKYGSFGCCGFVAFPARVLIAGGSPE
jgi:hypothetical protein